MEMDLTKDDLMALDVEKEKEKADRDQTVVSVVPSPESHAITLNGIGGSPRHSTPSTANHYRDDVSAARLHRANANQASRQPPPSLIPTKAVPDQLRLQSSLQSLRKSSTSSDEDEDSSDDLAMDRMSRPYKPPAATLPTGLCYDVRMRYHCELDPPKQRLDFHPEDPRRIYAIYKELCLAGLLDDPMSTRPIVSRPLLRVNARNATQAEICLVHDIKHFQFVERTKGHWVILHD